MTRLTGYGVRIGLLSVVALFLVGFGMWMFWSSNAVVEVEPSASSMAPGGTLSESTALATGQSPYEWEHELFGRRFHGLDFGSRSKLAGGAPVPKDWPVKKPVNIAHRGGKYIAPENTLVGFQEGLRAGADVLELDVHLTADGHLVVIHDDKVDRTTNGTGLVREMTLHEIKRLDAGYQFTSDGGKTYPYRGQGVVVPTLEEVYQEFPEVPFNVEIKEAQRAIEQELWQVIKEAEAADRTLVVSGKTSTIRRFREISGGQVATGASGLEIGVFYFLNSLHLSRLLSLIGGSSYQALQGPEEYRGLQIVTPGFVRAAHQLDLRVDVWTINTEPGMRRVLRYGVDGIMTDRPDVLNRVLDEERKGN